MAQYSATVFRFLKRLRWKANGNEKLNEAINRLVWYSFPVVYPDFAIQSKKRRIECENISQKRKRVRRYIRDMALSGPLYLVSLTFDECYESTTRQTRDKYARNWLNKHTADYFACLDRGKKNGREHYHAIVRLDYPLEEYKAKRRVYLRPIDGEHAWKHGFYTILALNTDEKDLNKTIEYAFKASTYAFKTADEDEKVKPFHKRNKGSAHWVAVGDEAELPF